MNNWKLQTARDTCRCQGWNVGKATERQVYWLLNREGFHYSSRGRKWSKQHG